MSEEHHVSLDKIQTDLTEIMQLLRQIRIDTSVLKGIDDIALKIDVYLIQTTQHLKNLQQLIQKKHPEFIFINTDLLKIQHNEIPTATINFTSIHQQIVNITIRLDQCAIHCKFCAELGVAPLCQKYWPSNV